MSDLRTHLMVSSSIGQVVSVKPTLEWTCPQCRTRNEELFDTFRIKVECGYCGYRTFLKGMKA